jgi:alpha/beta superfamily hydrolase
MSERVELTTAEGLVLDAWLAPGTRGAAVIAPPHPLYGGRMDNPVVEALALGLERAGVSTLRFDFRGCGRSQGHASGEEEDADADYAAALELLHRRCSQPPFAAGYSFGAAAAIRAAAAQPSLLRAIVVAPPLGMLDRETLERVRGRIHVLLGDADAFAPLDAMVRLLAGLPNIALTRLTGVDHFFAAASTEIEAFAEQAGGSSGG